MHNPGVGINRQTQFVLGLAHILAGLPKVAEQECRLPSSYISRQRFSFCILDIGVYLHSMLCFASLCWVTRAIGRYLQLRTMVRFAVSDAAMKSAKSLAVIDGVLTRRWVFFSDIT